ncbi:hypothetical protein PILCRDRAFT_823731 [Piloderma croceum F 1598]|uniref:Uncharacterized protein n=1 Tax=Piloderma croceum (strain F 1598) TaxID=765440 RepID=A0A0C3BPE4_PILCF|nr:hypothetical protein PILCRDRAFT_823731 [Piloderma croceum F 1598]
MSTLTTSPMTPARWKSLTSSERAHIRQFQLKRIEQEQLLEEKEALKMTEEERQTLLSSFSSVKTEFCDLDGLSWADSSYNDLTGSYNSVESSRVHSDSETSVPSGITTNAIIDLGNTDVQQRFKDSQLQTSWAKHKDVETVSRPLESPRTWTQIQSLDAAVSDSTSLRDDDTIRVSNYRALLLPSPFSPSASHTSPGSVSPTLTYSAGVAIFRCPSASTLWSGFAGSVPHLVRARTEDMITSISGQPQPVGTKSPASRLSITHSSTDATGSLGKWNRSILGLGLPMFSLGVGLMGENQNIDTDSKRSYLEPSRMLDSSCVADAAVLSQPITPSKLISGLPQASVIAWPSPFGHWNSQQSSPASDVTHVPSLGPTFPVPSDTSTVSPLPSTASRWLEKYHSIPYGSSQTLESENAGLGLGAISLKSPRFPFPHALDSLTDHSQALSSKSTAISGLPHSSISQWPLSPDITGWKLADVSGPGPALSSASPRWSLCPLCPPLLTSETFDTSCALPSVS